MIDVDLDEDDEDLDEDNLDVDEDDDDDDDDDETRMTRPNPTNMTSTRPSCPRRRWCRPAGNGAGRRHVRPDRQSPRVAV